MEISSNLSNTGIEGADKFEKMIEDIALTVKSGNIDFEVSNVLGNSVEFSIVFNSSDLLPEEDEEWKVSVALNFKMTLNSNSGLEFKVAEFTKEHAKEILGGNSGNRRSGRVCRWIIFSNSISFRRRCVVDPTGGSTGINEIINKKGKLENVYKIQADR